VKRNAVKVTWKKKTHQDKKKRSDHKGEDAKRKENLAVPGNAKKKTLTCMPS